MACTMYVVNLHPDVTVSLLWGKFGSVSRVYSIHLQRDKVSGVSLEYTYVNYEQWSEVLLKVVPGENGSGGRGFVHYERIQAAEAAIKRPNGMLFNDQKVFIKHSRTFKDCKGATAVPAVPAAGTPPVVPAADLAALTPAPRVVHGAAPAAGKKTAPPLVTAAVLAAAKVTPCVVSAAVQAAAIKAAPHMGPAATLAAVITTQHVVRGAAPPATRKRAPPLVPAAVLAAAKTVPVAV